MTLLLYPRCPRYLWTLSSNMSTRAFWKNHNTAASAVSMIRRDFRYDKSAEPSPLRLGAAASGGHGCSFSTTTTTATASSNPTAIDNKDDDRHYEEIVLYQRVTNPSVRMMRSGLACSLAHTLYWIWYTKDFIPLVNASAMNELHIDPGIGYAGIAFGLALNVAFVIYPKRLVSKLTYRPSESKLMVYTHRLPWVRPSDIPNASFPVGPKSSRQSDNKDVTYFKLKASSPHAQQIIQELRGDLTRYQGNLPVGTKWPKYALDIQSSKDVPEPEYLLEALIRPETFQGDQLVADIRREQQSPLQRQTTNTASSSESTRPLIVKFPKPRRKYGSWTTTSSSFSQYKKGAKGKRKR